MKPTFDSLEALKARAADPNLKAWDFSDLLALPVVSAVAANNPNLPEAHYLEALRAHPTELLTNPAFQLTLAASAELMQRIIGDDGVFHAALSNEHCPTAFILYALSRPTKARIQALLANPRLEERYLYDIERLIRDKTISGIRIKDVRAHANHPDGQDEDPEEALLRELALTSTRVTTSILRGLPASYYQALLNGNGEDYARHPEWLPDQTVLANHPDIKVRARAATAATSDPRLQELLAEDKVVTVRAALASNPDLQPYLLDKLSTDPELEVRTAVAANPRLPFDIAERLIAEGDIQINEAIIDLPDCPPGILRQVWRRWRNSPAHAKHATKLLRNPNCPGDVLDDAILLDQERSDGSAFTTTAAEHPNLPARHYPHLARSVSVNTRIALAANPNLPEELFLLLAQDLVQRVRLAIARNPSLPDYIRQGLQNDPHSMVRAAAGAPDETPAYLVDYRATPNTERLAMALNRNSRPQTLEWLATKADSPTVRLAVALNPSATPEAIAALAKDAHRTVREAAQRRAAQEREA